MERDDRWVRAWLNGGCSFLDRNPADVPHLLHEAVRQVLDLRQLQYIDTTGHYPGQEGFQIEVCRTYTRRIEYTVRASSVLLMLVKVLSRELADNEHCCEDLQHLVRRQSVTIGGRWDF